MESLLSAIAGFLAGLGTGYVVSIKVISRKSTGSHSRATTQSRIEAGGDVAGGDIKK